MICVSCQKKELALLKGKYQNYIGYLDPESTKSDKGFELCGNGIRNVDLHFTHSPKIEYAYNPNKGVFKQYIQSEYKNKGYTASGYLNFRFIVNCEGKVGYIETIEMDMDLEEASMSPDLVQQLLELTTAMGNWKGLQIRDVSVDYYMYVSYKIQHGEITEILP